MVLRPSCTPNNPTLQFYVMTRTAVMRGQLLPLQQQHHHLQLQLSPISQSCHCQAKSLPSRLRFVSTTTTPGSGEWEPTARGPKNCRLPLSSMLFSVPCSWHPMMAKGNQYSGRKCFSKLILVGMMLHWICKATIFVLNLLIPTPIKPPPYIHYAMPFPPFNEDG